jgi:thiol-disulfide isomerase/thioredoxin
MKKRLFLFAAVVVMAGCAGQRQAQVERGWIYRATLMKPEHHQFKERFDTVQVEQQFVPMIKSVQEGVTTIVFLGTWCPDSRREVPRFLKLADETGIPQERIKLYALDRSKKSDDGLSEQYHIERIPTFIFLKHGEEIGRITEVPEKSVEQDALLIMAKKSSQ